MRIGTFALSGLLLRLMLVLEVMAVMGSSTTARKGSRKGRMQSGVSGSNKAQTLPGGRDTTQRRRPWERRDKTE